MGTRSLTIVRDESGHKVLTMYRHFDGYPTGHGKDLKDFLSDMVVVNGIGSKTPMKASNGMGCLAAQLVKHFKEGIGGIYLYSSKCGDADARYIYTITFNGEDQEVNLIIEATRYKKAKIQLFKGNPKDFDPEETEKISIK